MAFEGCLNILITTQLNSTQTVRPASCTSTSELVWVKFSGYRVKTELSMITNLFKSIKLFQAVRFYIILIRLDFLQKPHIFFRWSLFVNLMTKCQIIGYGWRTGARPASVRWVLAKRSLFECHNGSSSCRVKFTSRKQFQRWFISFELVFSVFASSPIAIPPKRSFSLIRIMFV